MIIAVPTNHEYRAAALVRDCGFRAVVRVDAGLRELALALDPIVSAEHFIANMSRSPRLSSRLEGHDGDWVRAIAKTPEIGRFIEALRREVRPRFEAEGDTVVVGVDSATQWAYLPAGAHLVAIAGRIPAWVPDTSQVDCVIADGSVTDHEAAVVAYARSLQGAEVVA